MGRVSVKQFVTNCNIKNMRFFCAQYSSEDKPLIVFYFTHFWHLNNNNKSNYYNHFIKQKT